MLTLDLTNKVFYVEGRLGVRYSVIDDNIWECNLDTKVWRLLPMDHPLKSFTTALKDADIVIMEGWTTESFYNSAGVFVVKNHDTYGTPPVPESGTKADTDKPQMSLLSSIAIEELTKVLDFGARKYAPNNWRKGLPYSRVISALLRHVFAFLRGEDNDPETGLSHIAHAMCNCMFLLEFTKTRGGLDDRYKSKD